MKMYIIDKHTHVKKLIDSDSVVLKEPVIVEVPVSYVNTERTLRDGNDLIIVLKDGSQIVLASFYKNGKLAQKHSLVFDDNGANEGAWEFVEETSDFEYIKNYGELFAKELSTEIVGIDWRWLAGGGAAVALGAGAIAISSKGGSSSKSNSVPKNDPKVNNNGGMDNSDGHGMTDGNNNGNTPETGVKPQPEKLVVDIHLDYRLAADPIYLQIGTDEHLDIDEAKQGFVIGGTYEAQNGKINKVVTEITDSSGKLVSMYEYAVRPDGIGTWNIIVRPGEAQKFKSGEYKIHAYAIAEDNAGILYNTSKDAVAGNGSSKGYFIVDFDPPGIMGKPLPLPEGNDGSIETAHVDRNDEFGIFGSKQTSGALIVIALQEDDGSTVTVSTIAKSDGTWEILAENLPRVIKNSEQLSVWVQDANDVSKRGAVVTSTNTAHMDTLHQNVGLVLDELHVSGISGNRNLITNNDGFLYDSENGALEPDVYLTTKLSGNWQKAEMLITIRDEQNKKQQVINHTFTDKDVSKSIEILIPKGFVQNGKYEVDVKVVASDANNNMSVISGNTKYEAAYAHVDVSLDNIDDKGYFTNIGSKLDKFVNSSEYLNEDITFKGNVEIIPGSKNVSLSLFIDGREYQVKIAENSKNWSFTLPNKDLQLFYEGVHRVIVRADYEDVLGQKYNSLSLGGFLNIDTDATVEVKDLMLHHRTGTSPTLGKQDIGGDIYLSGTVILEKDHVSKSVELSVERHDSKLFAIDISNLIQSDGKFKVLLSSEQNDMLFEESNVACSYKVKASIEDAAGNKVSGVTSSYTFGVNVLKVGVYTDKSIDKSYLRIGTDEYLSIEEAKGGFNIAGSYEVSGGKINKVIVEITDSSGKSAGTYEYAVSPSNAAFSTGTWEIIIEPVDAQKFKSGEYKVYAYAIAEDEAGVVYNTTKDVLGHNDTAHFIVDFDPYSSLETKKLISNITIDSHDIEGDKSYLSVGSDDNRYLNIDEAKQGFVIGGTYEAQNGKINKVVTEITDSSGKLVSMYEYAVRPDGIGTWNIIVRPGEAQKFKSGEYKIHAYAIAEDNAGILYNTSKDAVAGNGSSKGYFIVDFDPPAADAIRIQDGYVSPNLGRFAYDKSADVFEGDIIQYEQNVVSLRLDTNLAEQEIEENVEHVHLELIELYIPKPYGSSDHVVYSLQLSEKGDFIPLVNGKVVTNEVLDSEVDIKTGEIGIDVAFSDLMSTGDKSGMYLEYTVADDAGNTHSIRSKNFNIGSIVDVSEIVDVFGQQPEVETQPPMKYDLSPSISVDDDSMIYVYNVF